MPDTSSRYIKFIVYLVVIVLVNIAGSTLFFRLDLTKNRSYSLSEASKRVVDNLTEPLTIKVFFTENLPAPHNATEQYLRDLLSEYAANSNRYFNYKFYNVSAEAGDISESAQENQNLAKNYGINPIQIQIVEKDEIKFRNAYMGLVLIHGDIIEKVPTITTTDGLEYQLTMAIQKLNSKVSALLGLTEKIRVRVFLSSSLIPVSPLMGLEHLDKLPGEIEKAVEELNGKNYGKLAYEFIDPTQNPAMETEADKYDLMKIKWPAVEKENIPEGSGIIGLALVYGDKAVNIPLLQVFRLPLIGTQYRALEPAQISELIDGSLAGLIDIHEALGVLSGKGTLDIGGGGANPMMPQQRPDSITGLKTLLENSYSIRNVALDGVIPVDVQCLLIARPTDKFSDYELFQIDQFLMRGGNLALVMDAFREFIPPQNMGARGPMYLPLDTGLEKLLDLWGISINQSIVLDENCYKQRLPQNMGGGERNIYFAPMIQNRFIDKELSIMENIKGLIAVNISPLTLDEKKVAENGLTARRLFSSSEKSWEMKDRINLNPDMIQPPASADEQKSMPLAYILEGSFPSYFAGKPIPEKPEEKKEEAAAEAKKPEDNGKKEEADNPEQPESKAVQAPDIEGSGVVLTKGKPAKVLILPASEMLKDTVLEAEGRSPNAIFVMNLLDYLNDREDVAVMRSKEQQFNPLAKTGSGLKTAVKAINIAGLPIIVVAFGLLIWTRRASRKRRLKMMFQKQDTPS